jgi:hypothetical protein
MFNLFEYCGYLLAQTKITIAISLILCTVNWVEENVLILLCKCGSCYLEEIGISSIDWAKLSMFFTLFTSVEPFGPFGSQV